MSKVNLNQLKKTASNVKNYIDTKTKALPEKYDAYILNNAVPESSVTGEVYGDQATLYKISDSDIVFPKNSILTDEDLKYKLSSINKLSETQKCIITYNDGTQDITKNIELEQGSHYPNTYSDILITLKERYKDENGEIKSGLFVVVAIPDDSSSPQSDERLMRPVYKYLQVKKISLYIEWYTTQLSDKAIIDLNFDKITNLPTDIEKLKNYEADVLTREEKILLIKNRSLWGSENIGDYNKAPYITSAPNNTFRNPNNISNGITVKAKKPALGKGLKIEPFYYAYTYYLYYRKSPNVVIDIINSKGTILHSLNSNEDADTLQIYNLGANTFDKNNDCYFVFSLKEDAPANSPYGVYQFHLVNMGDSILTYADVDKKLDKKEISKYALISYVDNKVAGIVNSAPETLDTLQELATALGNDPNFATTVATQIGKKVDKVDGKGLSTNDLTNDLKANYDAAYAYSQAKHSYNDLTDKPTIPSIAGLATTEYVDSKSLPILFLDDSNRTGDKLFPLLPEHNLVFIAGDAKFTDENGNINIIYGLCYSDLQADGSKLLTEYRTSKSASIAANGTLKSFDYIDDYTKTILTLFKNAPSGKVLVKNKNNTFEWVELPSSSDLSSYAPITSPVFKKSITVGDIDPEKTLGENSIIVSSYGEASGIYTLSNGKAAAARANYSHAEGYASMTKGIYSHAEGEQTGAEGQASHSEGNGATAKGIASHAEGYYTTSNGKYSHAEGNHTIATGDNQHVQGKYNIEDKANKYAHIVGNGYRDERNYVDHRSNGYTLDWSGNGWFAGKVTQEGTPTDAKDLVNKKYVDDKTSIQNVIYEGNGSAPDAISDYWTECPVSKGNGCWVINKQIEFDSSKPNPYYLLCDNTLYSPENSTFDKTNSAWIYPKPPNAGTVFICNKYNDENKLVLPWDDVNNPGKIKLYTKTELAAAMFSGDYNDLSNKPTIPSIEGLATEEYVNNKVTDTATSLTNDPDIYLTKDKYQYVTGVNTVDNMIWLPSTDLPAFLKIHLYVTNCKMQSVFDTAVKWKSGQNPNEGKFKIVTDDIYEFILTYINGSWIGEVVTYSNAEYIPTNDADVTNKKYVDNLTVQATSEEVKNMLNTTLGGDYSDKKN